MDGEIMVFKGRKAALLTKHNKEKVIRPAIENAVGCKVVVATGYDTDQFGTFTLEIPREGSQLETARRKAYKAMELTGLDIGLASEGSFGPNPSVPFMPFNVEMVILVDARESIEIHGICANGSTNFSQKEISSLKEAEEFARETGFPSHYLIVSSSKDGADSFIKGINTWQWLYETVERELKKSPDGKIRLITDMRAHANPTRMDNIRMAAEDLVKKMKQLCPQCGAPGFSITGTRKGLPCEWCGLPTQEAVAEIYQCRKCGFIKEQPVNTGKKAPAGRCEFCNP